MSPFLVLVPIVVAFVSWAKGLGLGTRLAPVAAVVVGVLLAVLVGDDLAGEEMPLAVEIVSGLVVGLTAAGSYSGTRAIMNPDGS